MASWIRKEVPSFCERLIGFSVPTNDQILVLAYDGVHVIKLGEEINVLLDVEADYDIFEDARGIDYRSEHFDVFGLHSGDPLLRSPQGEQLKLDQVRQVLNVCRGDLLLFSMTYENFSGDWAAATFSTDGNWIALGSPYDFDFVILQRANQVEIASP